MACRGAWRPVLEFLAAAIRRQTGIRDYIAGEKVIQGLLAAYLGATDHFVFHTERELAGTTGRRRSGNLPQGYADICLEPFLVRFGDMRHGYVIELKYLKRSATGTEERVAVAALPGRRTLGAAVPIGALHRPGACVPRLGTGAQRRDALLAAVPVHVHRDPTPAQPTPTEPPALNPHVDRSYFRFILLAAPRISYADATHEPARRHPSMSPMHSSTTSRSGWEPSTIAWAAIGNSSSMSASTT